MASEGVSEGPFAGAGAAPGLEIWRIEDFAPAPVEKVRTDDTVAHGPTSHIWWWFSPSQAFHGQFYVGDSYVLLFTRRTSRGWVACCAGFRWRTAHFVVANHGYSPAPLCTTSTSGLVLKRRWYVPAVSIAAVGRNALSLQDERGSAAKFAVELDDGLGGSPKEYREVQGHESVSSTILRALCCLVRGA